MTTEELYYKELCKVLLTKLCHIFGLLYAPTRNKQALLDKIYHIAGEGYNINEKETKKGLWN